MTAARTALALLEAVARLGPGATARQISALSEVPPATAYRLLNVLVAEGYLVRIVDLSGFALGRRTRELAGAVRDEPIPDDSVRTVARELRDHVRCGIFVATFDGGRVRLIDRDPDHELAGEQAIAMHLHGSAIGKLLLAQRPDLVPPQPRALTRHTIVDLVALAGELRDVRETGVAREVDEMRTGRAAVAVALRADGVAIGALAAIGRSATLPVTDPALLDLLRAGAERIRTADPCPRR